MNLIVSPKMVNTWNLEEWFHMMVFDEFWSTHEFLESQACSSMCGKLQANLLLALRFVTEPHLTTLTEKK